MKKCRARENRERNKCSESIWIRLKWWAELLTFHLLHHKLDSTFVCTKNNGAVLILKKSIKLLKLSLFYFYSYWLALFQVLHSKYFAVYFTDWKNFSTCSYKSYYNKPNWLSLQRLYFILQHEIETEHFICWEGATIFFYMEWSHSLPFQWPQRSRCLKYFSARLFVNCRWISLEKEAEILFSGRVPGNNSEFTVLIFAPCFIKLHYW